MDPGRNSSLIQTHRRKTFMLHEIEVPCPNLQIGDTVRLNLVLPSTLRCTRTELIEMGYVRDVPCDPVEIQSVEIIYEDS